MEAVKTLPNRDREGAAAPGRSLTVAVRKRLADAMRGEAGQALAEFGLMAPVLLLLLGGVVYCGMVVITQEELAIAARHVARKAALDSTAKNLSKAQGAPASGAVRDAALGEALANRRGASLKGVNWSTLGRHADGPGDLTGRGYTAMLTKTSKTLQHDGQKYKFGIGVVYHGVTVNKDMAEFAPIAKMAGLPRIEVGSSSVMPSELPIKGSREVEGILELNPWITDIVNDKKVFKRRRP